MSRRVFPLMFSLVSLTCSCGLEEGSALAGDAPSPSLEQAATTACANSPLFCDDFSSATPPAQYQTQNGTWTRQLGHYVVAGGSVNWQRALALLPDSRGDFDVTVTGSSRGDAGLGLVYSAQTTGSAYAVIVHPAQFQGVYLKELIPGQTSDREIQSYALPAPRAGQSLTLRVKRVGAQVTAWLDGQQVLSANDGSAGRAGKLGLLLSVTDQLTNAGADFTLLRLDSSTTQPPPTGGNISGLPWPSGVGTDNLTGFETWRGRKSDFYETWPNRWSWTEIRNPDIYGAISSYAGKPGRLQIGIAMLPEDGSGSFATCATGAYDQYYKDIGARLVSLGRGDSVIRLGWEANGDWYKWSIGSGDPTPYIQCFRREVQALRSTAPNLRIDWNMNKDSHMGTRSVAAAYPGDAYVDIIGVDFYDAWPKYTDQAAWDADFNATQNGGPRGLGAWLNFARSHGKKLSLPEWGLNGSDNAFFMQKMYDFFQANAASIAYECVFNIDPETAGQFMFYPATYNPNAAARYRSLWMPH